MLKSIVIIGAGNLGSSIAQGILKSSFSDEISLTLTKRDLKPIQSFEKMGARLNIDNKEAVKEANVILLSVKPYHVESIVHEIAPFVHSNCVIISLASGISIAQLNGWLPQNECYRAMPNIAAEIHQSATCLSYNGEEPDPIVHSIFNTVGTVEWIDEKLMEAATVLGACGTAFVLRFMRAMVQGGIEIGFNASTAERIVNQTVLGTAQLMQERDLHPEAAIDLVTTPKGCTIAGLNEMEHRGFSSALIKGIKTSFEKV